MSIQNTTDTNHHSINVPAAQKLSLFALVGLIFFTVSGGAYGLESLVGKMNPGWAVALVLLTPLFWALPEVLMVAELSSAMPEEGGYYIWVQRAMGTFWGVQEGWFTICYTAVDMAIYPVLFVDYLAYFFPSLRLDDSAPTFSGVFWSRWVLALLVIGFSLALNMRGAKAVGENAIVSIFLVLVPFLILAVIGLARHGAPASAMTAIIHGLSEKRDAGMLAVGLSVVVWNFCGSDNVSTYAGEVKNPSRAYPRALSIALPLIILSYLLPLLAGIGVTTDAAVWNETAGWPVIAQLIGGKWLGVLLALAALISTWALFNSQLLYASRLPYVMACDGWLPKALTQVSNKTNTPGTALLASCLVTALFTALSFGKLVVIDILLYSAGVGLEFAALIVLRIKNPEMVRPFRVPGGWVVLILITLSPMCVAGTVAVSSIMSEEGAHFQIPVVLLLLASGSLLYFLRRGRAEKLLKEKAIPGEVEGGVD